jgi:chromosome segregation protein
MRQALSAHESVVTKDGIWIGLNWLRLNKGDNSQIGVFEREA